MAFYGKTVSVTGGSPQRLITVLQANSFSGSQMGFKLTLAAPSAASLFVGDSTVSDSGATKGLEIVQGDTVTWSATGRGNDFLDPALIYLFVASTADCGVALWSV